MEQVAEAGMQVSKHSVELRVQLLTREGSRWGGGVSGWLTERVPRIQTQDRAQSGGGLSETAAALVVNRKVFWILYWDCLQGSGAPTLHAESEGSCYLLQRVWKKNLQYQCGPCGFPRPLLQIYYRKTKRERHAFKVLRSRQTHSRGEADAHRCFRTGTQTDTVQPGTQEQIPDTFFGPCCSNWESD